MYTYNVSESSLSGSVEACRRRITSPPGNRQRKEPIQGTLWLCQMDLPLTSYAGGPNIERYGSGQVSHPEEMHDSSVSFTKWPQQQRLASSTYWYAAHCNTPWPWHEPLPQSRDYCIVFTPSETLVQLISCGEKTLEPSEHITVQPTCQTWQRIRTEYCTVCRAEQTTRNAMLSPPGD